MMWSEVMICISLILTYIVIIFFVQGNFLNGGLFSQENKNINEIIFPCVFKETGLSHSTDIYES